MRKSSELVESGPSSTQSTYLSSLGEQNGGFTGRREGASGLQARTERDTLVIGVATALFVIIGLLMMAVAGLGIVAATLLFVPAS